jgi:hypothetical protein
MNDPETPLVELTASAGKFLNKIGTNVYLRRVFVPADDTTSWAEVEASAVPEDPNLNTKEDE